MRPLLYISSLRVQADGASTIRSVTQPWQSKADNESCTGCSEMTHVASYITLATASLTVMSNVGVAKRKNHFTLYLERKLIIVAPVTTPRDLSLKTGRLT